MITNFKATVVIN